MGPTFLRLMGFPNVLSMIISRVNDVEKSRFVKGGIFFSGGLSKQTVFCHPVSLSNVC